MRKFSILGLNILNSNIFFSISEKRVVSKARKPIACAICESDDNEVLNKKKVKVCKY